MAGGDDDSTTDLFAGVEGGPPANCGQRDESENVLPDGGGLDAALDPRAALRHWANSLTYREVHAFIWGFAPWFLALATGEPLLVTGALAVVLVSLGLLKFPNRKAPNGLLCETHYALGGAVLGFLLGGVLLGVLKIVTALGGLVA
jgi:hypothetical protein